MQLMMASEQTVLFLPSPAPKMSTPAVRSYQYEEWRKLGESLQVKRKAQLVYLN